MRAEARRGEMGFQADFDGWMLHRDSCSRVEEVRAGGYLRRRLDRAHMLRRLGCSF